METTMTVNPIVTHESCFDTLGKDPDFEVDADDSVREAFEFIRAMGLDEADSSSIAIEMIELS